MLNAFRPCAKPVGPAMRSFFRSTVVAISLAVLSAGAFSATELTWPEPRLPADVTTFAMGQTMTVDGMPMHLKGFVSRQRPAALAESVRRSLGQPLVESTHGGKQILGRAEGRFYMTVQIEATGTGSKGIVAMVDLTELAKNRLAIESTRAQLLSRLPAGSTVASDMRSEDGGKDARHTVILNDHGQALNRDAMVGLLTAEGYVLEREAEPAGAVSPALSRNRQEASTLHFRAPGKEAMVVIARSGTRTAIVLNTVSTLKANP